MPVEYKHDTISIDLKERQLLEEKTPVKGKTNVVEARAAVQANANVVAANANVVETVEAVEAVEARAAEAVVPAINSPVKLLLERMMKNYNLAIVPNKPKRGEENWYKACSEVIDEMSKLGFERDSLLDALTAHICDDLLFEDKMLLLNQINSILDKDDFTERVERYLFKDTLTDKGLRGLFVLNKGVAELYIAGPSVAGPSASAAGPSVAGPSAAGPSASAAGPSVAGTSARQLSLAQAEDKYDLERPIAALKNTFLPAKTKLSSVVGFVSNFKKEVNNIVFKMKVFTLKGIVKKRNKGARCYGKSLEMMEEIMGEETLRAYLDLIHIKYKDIIDEKKKNRILNKTEEGTVDELESINHMHACVVQEMFLRTYNIQEKNGKRWFLTPEEAVLVDIENATALL